MGRVLGTYVTTLDKNDFGDSRVYFQEILWTLILNADKNADKLEATLANSAIARDCVAGSTGLEPAASGVTGRRSNQTELRPPESGEMVGDTRIELVTYGL